MWRVCECYRGGIVVMDVMDVIWHRVGVSIIIGRVIY